MKRTLVILSLFILSCAHEELTIITTIDPDYGFATSETTITVKGIHIHDQLKVYLDEEQLDITMSNNETLIATLPENLPSQTYRLIIKEKNKTIYEKYFTIIDAFLFIYAIDVGQGDGTLIIGPNGTVLLIDGGPTEAGREKILPFLGAHNIHSIDYYIISHFHEDHVGGVDEVMSGFDGKLGTSDDLLPTYYSYDHGESYSSSSYDDYIQAMGKKRKTIEPGNTIDLGGEALITCIVVNGNYIDGQRIQIDTSDENQKSVGLLLSFGNFSFWISGDLTGGGGTEPYKTIDLESTVADLIGDIDILRVNHHGSETSSNAYFLSKLLPEIAIISVGDNDYGHPRNEILKRLEKIEAEIFTTKNSGTIGIEVINGQTWSVTSRNTRVPNA